MSSFGMTPRIKAVATATPPNRFSQEEILALVGYQDLRRRAFFLHSEVDGIELAAFEPLVKAEYLDLMGWTQVEGRFRIKLSKEVRRIAPTMIKEVTDRLLGAQRLTKQEIRHWVLHSAGRKVLDRTRDLVGLTEEDLQASRKILRQYGNLSAATVLFVLEEIVRSRTPQIGDLGVMVALGPGFAAEAALLRWV